MAAPEGNKYAEGNEGGRPIEYKEAYNEKAYKLCLMGATDAELADFFDVTEQTINNWKKQHEEFFASIRAGKKDADMNVSESLYKSAQDKEIKEQVPIKLKKVYWQDGKRCEEETIELVEVTKTVPADFRAQQYWLNNRQGSKWRTRQDVTTDGKELPATHINLGSGQKPPEE